jgi:hypothetical protein
MFKTSLIGLAAALAVLSAGTAAVAQTPAPAAAPQTVFTFVAEWQLPRDKMATYATDFEKNTRPILEKLGAAGTLVSWGAYEYLVHTPEGYTHGVWWSATSYAGIETARGELVKNISASTSLTSATGHGDRYLRAIGGKGKSASGTGGFLTVSRYEVKAGSAQDWRQLWDKNNKASWDDAVDKDILNAYAIYVEDVHTEAPGLRLVVTLSPSAEAEDKFGDALAAADGKLSAADQKTAGLQMAAVLEPGKHRDGYAKIIRHWRK